MTDPRIVTHAEWLAARTALLAQEKELTRLRDELSAARRALPWERVEKRYSFITAKGAITLADLFDGKSQLVVYHFMFEPDDAEGCKSCSWWADNFERNVVHLAHRDVSLVAVSRAPVDKLSAYAARMGWTFPWVSSLGSDFNGDLGVTIEPEAAARGEAVYNYAPTKWTGECPGISVFAKDAVGSIFHTYSCYARGLDMMNAGYHYLDLVPKGRDEAALDYGMAWLRRRDQYDPPPVALGKKPR